MVFHKMWGISLVAQQLPMKLFKGFCVFIFLMKRVVPQVVGKLLLVLKTGYMCSHAVSYIHAEPNDIAMSHSTVEVMCITVDK